MSTRVPTEVCGAYNRGRVTYSCPEGQIPHVCGGKNCAICGQRVRNKKGAAEPQWYDRLVPAFLHILRKREVLPQISLHLSMLDQLTARQSPTSACRD